MACLRYTYGVRRNLDFGIEGQNPTREPRWLTAIHMYFHTPRYVFSRTCWSAIMALYHVLRGREFRVTCQKQCSSEREYNTMKIEYEQHRSHSPERGQARLALRFGCGQRWPLRPINISSLPKLCGYDPSAILRHSVARHRIGKPHGFWRRSTESVSATHRVWKGNRLSTRKCCTCATQCREGTLESSIPLHSAYNYAVVVDFELEPNVAPNGWTGSANTLVVSYLLKCNILQPYSGVSMAYGQLLCFVRNCTIPILLYLVSALPMSSLYYSPHLDCTNLYGIIRRRPRRHVYQHNQQEA